MRDDVELLIAWRDGDKAAGEALVERHFDRLRRFFRGHLDDGIGDLIQRTWLACIAKCEHIEVGKFRAFLLGVAYRELLQSLRKHQRRDRAMIRFAADAALGTTPSQVLIERERQRLLRWAMRKIPSESSAVIQLLYWEDLPVSAIAEILEVPPGTVKSRLHRARAQLRATMESAGASAWLVESAIAVVSSPADGS